VTGIDQERRDRDREDRDGIAPHLDRRELCAAGEHEEGHGDDFRRRKSFRDGKGATQGGERHSGDHRGRDVNERGAPLGVDTPTGGRHTDQSRNAR
jgi:hypothetical protein